MLMDKIRDLAEQKGIKIKDLCEKSGVPYSCMYEWNEHEPTASRLIAVANALGVSVEKLLEQESA